MSDTPEHRHTNDAVIMQGRWFAEIAADYVQGQRHRAYAELAYFRDLPTDEAAILSAALRLVSQTVH